MWFFTKDSMINMDYVSSIDIHRIGGVQVMTGDNDTDNAEILYGVYLSFANSWSISPAKIGENASEGGSIQKNVILFEGDVNDCQMVLDSLKQKIQPQFNPYGVIYLSSILSEIGLE